MTATPSTRRALAAASVLAAVITAAAPLDASAAPSAGVPFKDSNIHGWLTFCDRSGQPVTSGALTSAPFVWKAISSAPAPAGYRSGAGRATLAAYQPLKYVDPGDWSGSQLTGSSTYTNPSHPVAQSTNADVPLLNFVQSYPPHWNGYVEIRMLFSGINLPQHITPYPAAVLKVTKTRWTLVRGGGGSCSDGQGSSDESKLLSHKRLKSHAVVLAGSSASSGSSGQQQGTSGHHGGTAASQASDAASTARVGGGSHSLTPATKAGIGLALVAVIGLISLAMTWWRRRTPQAGQ